MVKGLKKLLRSAHRPSEEEQLDLFKDLLDHRLAVLAVLVDISQTYPHIHSPNNDTR